MNVVKKSLLVFAAMVLLYLMFLIQMAPAEKLISRLSIPSNVHINQISGSVLSGQARSVTINNLELSNVNWSVSIFSLLTFNPTVTINFGDSLASIKGHADLSNLTSELLVRDIDVTLDANYVASQLTLPIDLIAGGQLRVIAQEYGVGKPICSVANGAITWPKANVIAMDQDVQLGDLSATLACDKGRLTIRVDPKNDLGLELNASVLSPKRITANGYVTPGEKFPKELEPVLGFLGRKDSQGRYKLPL